VKTLEKMDMGTLMGALHDVTNLEVLLTRQAKMAPPESTVRVVSEAMKLLRTVLEDEMAERVGADTDAGDTLHIVKIDLPSDDASSPLHPETDGCGECPACLELAKRRSLMN